VPPLQCPGGGAACCAMSIRKTDLLIIGSGIAGCAAALSAADRGLHVTILTKAEDPRASTATAWAQGGIIYTGEGDSPELLASDIWTAGAEFGHQPAIDQLSNLGPKYVEQYLVKRLDVEFDRDSSGVLDITEEAAHSVRRIIHVEDLTDEQLKRDSSRPCSSTRTSSFSPGPQQSICSPSRTTRSRRPMCMPNPRA
jgi:L-aspartate oxidase